MKSSAVSPKIFFTFSETYSSSHCFCSFHKNRTNGLF